MRNFIHITYKYTRYKYRRVKKMTIHNLIRKLGIKSALLLTTCATCNSHGNSTKKKRRKKTNTTDYSMNQIWVASTGISYKWSSFGKRKKAIWRLRGMGWRIGTGFQRLNLFYNSFKDHKFSSIILLAWKAAQVWVFVFSSFTFRCLFLEFSCWRTCLLFSMQTG